MSRPKTRANPTHAKHPCYQGSETGAENDLRLKGRIYEHYANVILTHSQSADRATGEMGRDEQVNPSAAVRTAAASYPAIIVSSNI